MNDNTFQSSVLKKHVLQEVNGKKAYEEYIFLKCAPKTVARVGQSRGSAKVLEFTEI